MGTVPGASCAARWDRLGTVQKRRGMPCKQRVSSGERERLGLRVQALAPKWRLRGGMYIGGVRRTQGHVGKGEGRSLEDRLRRYARHSAEMLGHFGVRGCGRSDGGRALGVVLAPQPG